MVNYYLDNSEITMCDPKDVHEYNNLLPLDKKIYREGKKGGKCFYLT